MSEFVSLYNVVFGDQNNQTVSDVTDQSSPIKREPPSLVTVASALEKASEKTYIIDKFGRFVVASELQIDGVLEVLSSYHKILANSQPYDIAHYEARIEDPADLSIWHNFGWLSDHLPNFEALHKEWRKLYGDMTVISLCEKVPKSTNSIWDMAGTTLSIIINDHLAGSGGNAEEYIAELMGTANTGKTMKLFKYLQTRGLKMEESTFRRQLKLIFHDI